MKGAYTKSVECVTNSVFLALGVKLEGEKELLEMWIAENESAKF